MTPGAEDLPVGVQLHEARERQGLMLEAVARSLRIPTKTLRALEEGDFASLPADVYMRGFLRQYAEALGLDAVPFLRAFAMERARLPVRAPVFPWTLAGRQPPRAFLWEFVSPRALTVAVGVLGLLVVLGYVLAQVRTYARPPRLEVSDPPHDIEVREPTLVVRGRTDPTAEVSINGERMAVRPDGNFEETVGVGEGVSTLRVVAKSIGGRETTVIRDVLLRSPPTPAPAAPGPAPTAGPFALTVRADTEVVWVALTADGEAAFAGLLLPGSERTVRGERVDVTSGKAARTLVRVDGEDRGALAEAPGPVHDATFTRDPRTGRVEHDASPKVSPR